MKSLAKVVQNLSTHGFVAKTAVSARNTRFLQPLFDTDVLVFQRSGGGQRIVVQNHEALSTFIQGLFPKGLGPALEQITTRAGAVAVCRNAKLARHKIHENVLIRAGENSTGSFVYNKSSLPVKEWTQIAKTAVVRIDESDQISITGSLAFVENEEVFYEFEKLDLDYDFIIFTGGRISQRLLGVIAASTKVTHFGDYDPVGMDEYLRIQHVFGNAELFVPENIEQLFDRHSKAELVTKNHAILERLRKTDNRTILQIVQLMDQYNGGVEQEILLVNVV